MKILIIVGFVIPEASKLINLVETPFGGWVTGLINNLKGINNVEIAVAMKTAGACMFTKKQNDGITYYYLPPKTVNNLDVKSKHCIRVLDDFKPNVIHAEGAEVLITKSFFEIFSGTKVLSIKGVLNDVKKYEFGGLSLNRLFNAFSLYNIALLFVLIYKRYIQDRKRLKAERANYKMADVVLGRTIYDKAFCYRFNKNVKYFHVNEILRSNFYNHKWSEQRAKKQNILIGNGMLARKGAHTAIEAIAILKSDYPNIKLNIVGNGVNSRLSKLKYQGYLNRIIKNKKLKENVEFLGILNVKEIVDAFLDNHIYLQPSYVENSSNTLGEAMLLGMPCVVAYSGGVSSIADDTTALFYKPDCPEMLALQIKRIIDKDNSLTNMNSRARDKAKLIYNKNFNTNILINVYNNILRNEI